MRLIQIKICICKLTGLKLEKISNIYFDQKHCYFTIGDKEILHYIPMHNIKLAHVNNIFGGAKWQKR